MASLRHHQIPDFVETTLDAIYARLKWSDVSMDLPYYTFASRWFGQKKKPEKGGPNLTFRLQVDNQGNAIDTGLFATITTSRKDVLYHGAVQWSKQNVHFIYDIDEPEFQGDRGTVIDHIKVLNHGMWNDYFAHMETRFWLNPTSSSLDPMPPSGVPHWIVKSATTPGGGFTGGDPSGWSSGAAGIATATYSGWKNWSFNYVQTNRDDLVEKVLKAMHNCYFKAPDNFPEIGKGKPNWGLYTVWDVTSELDRQLDASNDNMRGDVAKYSGNLHIKGVPVMAVPALENSLSGAYDSSKPFYGINWKKFHYFFKKGRNAIRMKAIQSPFAPSVREVHMVNWGNFLCTDRRSQFIGYVA